MSDASTAPAEETVRAGLLLETVQAHQRAAAEAVDRLRVLAMDLDAIVRDEIRRTLIDELKSLDDEVGRVVATLVAARRRLNVRVALWIVAASGAAVLISAGAVRRLLPSQTQIQALHVERDALARNVAALAAQGGRVAWSRCGSARRLCVRIDRRAPFYGRHGDYAIARGY